MKREFEDHWWGSCHLLYRFGVQAGRAVGLEHEEVA